MHLVVHCSTSRVPKQGISVSKSSVLGRPDPFPDLNHQTIFQEPLDESMIKCDITYKIGLRSRGSIDYSTEMHDYPGRDYVVNVSCQPSLLTQ